MEQTELVDWLLKTEVPSIRYLTLREMLGQPESDAEVQAARRAIMETGPVPVILAQQTDSGNWAGERSFYTPKYVSTHWSMMLLAELAADGKDSRLQRGIEFMLSDTRALLERDYASRDQQHGFACFWGNLVRYAAHCGRADDPRTQAVIAYLVYDLQDAGSRCPHNNHLPCSWGAARALWGLAALPVEQHTPEIEAAVQAGLTFLLDSFSLVNADYPTPGEPHALWSKLSFPLFYQTDSLFVLRVLADLNALDHPGAQPALERLAAWRGKNSRWKGTSPYRSRTWKGIVSGRDETNRWVSLQAARILQQAPGVN